MKILLKLICPSIRKTVILAEDVWRYKILHDHKEMESHLGLVEKTLKGGNVQVYRKRSDANKLAIFMETAYFLPRNRYLKIALEVKDQNTAVVTTAHSCFNIPGDMEPL